MFFILRLHGYGVLLEESSLLNVFSISGLITGLFTVVSLVNTKIISPRIKVINKEINNMIRVFNYHG